MCPSGRRLALFQVKRPAHGVPYVAGGQVEPEAPHTGSGGVRAVQQRPGGRDGPDQPGGGDRRRGDRHLGRLRESGQPGWRRALRRVRTDLEAVRAGTRGPTAERGGPAVRRRSASGHAQVRFGQVNGRVVRVEEDDEPGAAVLGDGSLGTPDNVETLRGVEVPGSGDTITMLERSINISFHQATIRDAEPSHRLR
jgi:hypothetical protein